MANPDFLKKYVAYQQSQKSHDPLWDLPSDQLRAYMQAQVISKNDPGGDSSTVRQLYAKVPQSFFDARTQYFNNLKASGVKFDSSQYNPKPGMPKDLQTFSDSYHNLPYGTGARSSALRSAEGQKYIAWLNQNKVYTNQQRADLGLPPLADTSSSYSSKSGYARKASKPKIISVGRTAKIKAPKAPKGVAVGKPKLKKTTLAKQSVKKLPVTKRKLA
jgi:hypothetical protein